MRTLIMYATREGQTRRIAEHIAAGLTTLHIEVEQHDVKTSREPIDWSRYDWACLAASVHAGHHEPEMIAFVKRHRRALDQLQAVFVSVTLSEAGAEDVQKPKAMREKAAADARRMIDVFIEETGWTPVRVLPVAGALVYSQYNFIIRLVMKRIARQAGAPTDTSRDYQFTDWAALDRFVTDAASAAISRTADVPAVASQRSAG
jgi:menaquinone-dependent protoporphyrinogen oxidase